MLWPDLFIIWPYQVMLNAYHVRSRMVFMPKTLCLLIPSSLTIESSDRRIKTYKIGQIARAASIFRVNHIFIYKDKAFDDSKFIDTVLRYLETPQYLRKKLFPLNEDLRNVGVVPPLRTAHHPLNSKSSKLSLEELREGIMIEKRNKTILVDIGVEMPARLISKEKLTKFRRITTKIISKDPLEVELINRDDISCWWGYNTKIVGSLAKTLKVVESGTVVFTSKHGEDFKGGAVLNNEDCVTFVFGSPRRGVESILKDEGLSSGDFSGCVVNTIPDQGTETVRTEEAIFATLAIYNAHCSILKSPT